MEEVLYTRHKHTEDLLPENKWAGRNTIWDIFLWLHVSVRKNCLFPLPAACIPSIYPYYYLDSGGNITSKDVKVYGISQDESYYKYRIDLINPFYYIENKIPVEK